MFEFKRIGCPTAFSEGAEQAILQASEPAQRSAAEICLVNVIPIQPALPTDPNYVFSIPEYEQRLRSEAERHLQTRVQQLTAKGLQS
jgi:nucleotide-binding universal stress UspA family protein